MIQTVFFPTNDETRSRLVPWDGLPVQITVIIEGISGPPHKYEGSATLLVNAQDDQLSVRVHFFDDNYPEAYGRTVVSISLGEHEFSKIKKDANGNIILATPICRSVESCRVTS